jgi:hypothetical protein
MRWREHEAKEPHGEQYRQQWMECLNPDCGAQFDEEEMHAIHKRSREA